MATDKTIVLGPFQGMNDTLSLAAQDAERAAYLENLIAPAASVGGDLISRPGFTRHDFASTARTGTIAIDASGNLTGTSTLFLTELAIGDLITLDSIDHIVLAIASDILGTVSVAGNGGAAQAWSYYPAGIKAGTIYGEYLYKNTNGTKKNYLIVQSVTAAIDGSAAGAYRFLGAASQKLRLVEYDPSSTLHPLTDRTSVTMNAVALDVTARIYGTTMAGAGPVNYLVLSDGTNRLRKISSTYVLSNLTDANYAFQGPLTIYYGKLFGIDANDKATLRWSEESDLDTGWGTGTSDNSWTLRQTSTDNLQCLIGTNDALYCFRQGSIAIISGAANSDFRSSGTVDAIQNIGTLSPDAVAVINNNVVFRDQYGRPCRIQPGYGYVPLWKRVQEQLRGIGKAAALQMAAWCRYDPVKNTIQFAYRTTTSATTNDLMLVYDVDSWECLGVHKVYATSAYAVMDHAYGCLFLDENLNPRLTIASGTTGDCAFYVQQNEDVQASSALDVTSGGSITVSTTVTTPKAGGDTVQEKTFSRVVVGHRNVGGTTAGITRWKVAYKGTGETAFSTAAPMLMAGSSAIPSGWTQDGGCYKSEAVGLAPVPSRWVQYQFTNDTSQSSATRATMDQVTVFGAITDTDYKRR